MESLLTAPVQLAQPHAIPFRTIFEENLQRRQNRFMNAVANVFDPRVRAWRDEQARAPRQNSALCPIVDPVPEGALAPPERMLDLLQAVRRQESAYAALAQAKDDIVHGRPHPGTKCLRTDVELELTECAAADAPLKRVLQLADASALCLSGGGIRSASFCLGVLQGLARISERPADQGTTQNLMENLDYLSTVSGGGYIGSWLMSWTYRRMLADLPEPKITEAFNLAADSAQRARAHCLQMLDTLERSPGLRTQESDAFSRNGLALSEAANLALKNASAALVVLHARQPDFSARFDELKSPAPQKRGDKRTPDLKTFLDDEGTAPVMQAISLQAEQAPDRSAATDLERENPAYFAQLQNALDAVGDLRHAKDQLARTRGRSLNAVADDADLKQAFIAVSGILDQVMRRFSAASNPDWSSAYKKVIASLAGQSCVTAGDPEPQPVRHLRSYSSFLAPELGATIDTTTLGAIILRNLVVNWAMLLPLLFALVSMARFSGFLMQLADARLTHGNPLFVAYVCTFLLFAMSAISAAGALPSHTSLRWLAVFRWSPKLLFVTPIVLGSWLLAVVWAPGRHPVIWAHHAWPWLVRLTEMLPGWVLYGLAQAPAAPIALLGFTVVGGSIFLTYSDRVTGRLLPKWRGIRTVLVVIAATVVVSTAATLVLMEALRREIFPFLMQPNIKMLSGFQPGSRLFIVFAVPLITVFLMTSTSLFCALLGIYEMEEDREWWVRAGGYIIAFDVLWIAAHALTLFGQQGFARIVSGVAGLAIGALGSAVGFSAASSSGTGPVKMSQLKGAAKFLSRHNLVLPVISAIAVALISIGMVELEETLRQVLPAKVAAHRYHLAAATPPLPPGQSPLTAIPHNENPRHGLETAAEMIVLATVVTILTNLSININLFSLQGMYRMRLMRAFLGASNVLRHPDPFTNFDPKDTPYEADLPSAPGAPLHIINTTLNLVGTTNPAWRQRKAESFTFSPIHAGSWRLGYVPADLYGGGRGVTLATAMAISGAAFNPNMGYQSSPLLALLMTFFNLRLGYWLPNPKRPTSRWPLTWRDGNFFSKSGPSFALFPLIEEALGMTNDTSRWIELTDGGHFENLGLYEMVLRRVRRVIVVDAGADPECQFEDLGNAIRKIKIDLGIPIEFDHRNELKMQKGMSLENSYCAVARIHYHCVDPVPAGTSDLEFDGELVYIKASITGREPADVLQYAKTHAAFPHESTANQFFNESQFETYRHLGSFVIESIQKRALGLLNQPGGTPFKSFVAAAHALWQDPVPADADAGSDGPSKKSDVSWEFSRETSGEEDADEAAG